MTSFPDDPLSEGPRRGTEYLLRERMKELSALHRAARLLQADQRPVAETLARMVELLPSAWQYPEITAGRIRFGDQTIVSVNWRETPWRIRADFYATGEIGGSIEVVYLHSMPEADEGPFLAEERELIDSLADMLRLHFERKLYLAALQDVNMELERRVIERTAQLTAVNVSLQEEIQRRRESESLVRDYEIRLRKLAADLVLAEHRERRDIAVQLHDHIGQALSLVKMKLQFLQGNIIFSGCDRGMGEIRQLLDQIIQYSRTLTFELSPPVLYELGLGAALEWLAEDATRRYGFPVRSEVGLPPGSLDIPRRVLAFSAARELLHNAAKHARPREAAVSAWLDGNTLCLKVSDDGSGFPASSEEVSAGRGTGFGLFSLRERLIHFGGTMDVESAPGAGTRVTVRVPRED